MKSTFLIVLMIALVSCGKHEYKKTSAGMDWIPVDYLANPNTGKIESSLAWRITFDSFGDVKEDSLTTVKKEFRDTVYIIGTDKVVMDSVTKQPKKDSTGKVIRTAETIYFPKELIVSFINKPFNAVPYPQKIIDSLVTVAKTLLKKQ